MKFSIITVSKNSARTIERTVQSVLQQRDVDYEHILKDACSTDNTVEIAKKINTNIIIRSVGDSGIYDGMNQGFSLSSGDIVAFLNSDDYYADSNVLRDVGILFDDLDCDYVYSNIRMNSCSGKSVRVWNVGNIGEAGLDGKQVPHPGFFVKRAVLSKLDGPFDPSYKISADLKQQLLIINKMRFSGAYLDRVVVEMETGGESTNSLKSYYLGWRESVRAFNEVFGHGGIPFVVKKVFSKFGGVAIRNQITDFCK